MLTFLLYVLIYFYITTYSTPFVYSKMNTLYVWHCPTVSAHLILFLSYKILRRVCVCVHFTSNLLD